MVHPVLLKGISVSLELKESASWNKSVHSDKMPVVGIEMQKSHTKVKLS